MSRKSLRASLIAALVSLGLAACGGAKPYDFQPTAGEMKPGPGLFSGADGEFVVYGE